MKITVLTYGSRGDVQPLIALTLGLMGRGHLVSLAAPARFENLVKGYGIHFIPLAGDPAELSRELNNSGQNPIKQIRDIMSYAFKIGAEVLQQTEEACKDADLIIHTFMHAVGAHTIACERKIPDIHIQLFPMFTPTGDYPNVTLPDLKSKFLNRLTHEISRSISDSSAKIGFEHVRRRAGLPKRKLYSPFDKDTLRPSTPILCAWSPSVISPSKEWAANIAVTGYYFSDVDTGYQPASDLQHFLDTGNPPICVSFGSMLNRDAKKIDSIIRESLRLTNNRGIILSGWSEVKNDSTKEILYIDAVPHQWLLPRCKVIIHHGGAGTTAAGLRAGIPNIVIPFVADQPFWGKRVHAIDAGPIPIPVNKISTEKLTSAIIETDKYAIRKHSKDIGQILRNEDGVGFSIDFIEKYSNDFLRLQL